MRLQDHVALITGATGDLGIATCAAFLREGAHVVASYRRTEQAERLKTQLGAPDHLTLIHADVFHADQVAALVSKAQSTYGRIDSLLNLVGGYAEKDVVDLTEEEWDYMINLNLRSAFLVCRGVLPVLLAQRQGVIINVSSRAAEQPFAGAAPYIAAKAGLIAFTRALAEEVKHKGVRVNCILPSIIDTEANRRDMPKADFSRWVKAEEIAEVLAFLSSPAASSITGAAVPVYGRV